MPSILFLTLKTFSSTGGVEKFNKCFARALEENTREKGWQMRMFSTWDSETDPRYLSAKAFRGFAKQKARFAWQVFRAARRTDIIIASHINLSPVLKICRLFFSVKKIVIIAHGVEVWQPLTIVQAWVLRHCNQVWSVSRYTEKRLLEEKKLSKSASRIFHNAIDPWYTPADESKAAQLRNRYGIKNHEKLVLTVSRMTTIDIEKGYDKLIKVMPAILKRWPDAKLLVCGKADDREQVRIMELINRLQINDAVILSGYMPEEDLPACYAAADIFVMASSKEGFGIVFIEAALAGLPIVAGNRDGSTDALLDGKLGMLVDPSNQLAIENAIIHLLASPLSTEEKEDRKNLVQSHFGFPVFKQRQADLLNALLGDGKG